MSKPEVKGLTGIRFYAALFVFLSHVVETIPGMEALGGGFLVFNVGVVSVSFFFVLSGFILTYNYADVFRNGVSVSDYTRFLWNRLGRCYPVHLLALGMVLPIALFSPNLPLDWRAVPLHVLLAQTWWPSANLTFIQYLNVPSWALSCEWFFYLLAPMIIFLMCSDGKRWILLAGMIAYMAILGWLLSQNPSDTARLYFVSWFAPSRCIEFLAGVALARTYLNLPSSLSPRCSIIFQVVGAVLIVVGAMYRASAPWPFWGGLLYVPGSALLILGLACGRGVIVAHLSQPMLIKLGVASFSFYMIHAPLIRAIKGMFLYQGWEVDSWPLFWGVAISIFLVIQVAALGVLLLIESPLQQRLRKSYPGV